MTLLIDGDIIAYRSATAVQKTRYTVTTDSSSVEILGKTAFNEYLANNPDYDEVTKDTVLEPVENALHIARQTIDGMREKFGTSKLKVFLTGNANFRKDIATILPYKGNRDPLDKPVYLNDVRTYLKERWKAEVVEGMEADDAMGIAATAPGSNTIICSIDKDLKMIPGAHFNWVKDEFCEVSDREAWRSFFKQMLTGDRTDNIPGLEGVGDKKADKILEGYTKPETMWCGVFRAYFDRYENHYSNGMLLKDALQEIGDLLWIRRTNQERWVIPE